MTAANPHYTTAVVAALTGRPGLEHVTVTFETETDPEDGVNYTSTLVHIDNEPAWWIHCATIGVEADPDSAARLTVQAIEDTILN